jgi:hypothetical protein
MVVYMSSIRSSVSNMENMSLMNKEKYYVNELSDTKESNRCNKNSSFFVIMDSIMEMNRILESVEN